MSHREKRKAREKPGAPPAASALPAISAHSPGQAANAFASRFPAHLAIPAICVLLMAMVWAVFGQTLRARFVHYDDDLYVVENPFISRGLSLRGITWSFTYLGIGHWHPVTWFSHMLDCQFYGLRAGGHHLTSVLLHGTATILLFLVLREMTGATWRSAFVAAVFAVHPLHVESVAWVAERKDVLSGVFFMLTLGAYARYARGPRTAVRYLPAASLFALGLMSKSMLVTLPLILLLLDYWPLHRWVPGTPDSAKIFRRLLVEKIPLFLLSAASCIMTGLAEEKLPATGQLPVPLRLENAVVSCAVYLRQMAWPSALIVPYPNPAGNFPWLEVLGAFALLMAITGAVFYFGKDRPWLAVGWLWYLVMLAPVIGIVQISTYAHADRYTYLPQIGLYITVTWLMAEGCARLRHGPLLAGCAAAGILAVFAIAAHGQVSYWKDDPALWLHTLAVMPDNAEAHNNLGADLKDNNQIDEAMAHFQRALEIKPHDAEAHYNIGNVFLQKGEMDNAISHYHSALEIKPGYAEASNNLGTALRRKGNAEEAILAFESAVQNKQHYINAENNLAYILAASPRASLRNGERAVALALDANQFAGGDNPVLLGTLAAAYAECRRFSEALATGRQALDLAYSQSNGGLAAALRYQIALYEAGKPFRDPGLGK